MKLCDLQFYFLNLNFKKSKLCITISNWNPWTSVQNVFSSILRMKILWKHGKHWKKEAKFDQYDFSRTWSYFIVCQPDKFRQINKQRALKMAKNFNSWWRDPSLVFYNKYYEPDEEVSQYMRENSQFLGIFFGAFRNKSTKHFVTYLNKFYRYIQQRDEPFDIIFVTLDEDEPECDFFVNACMEEWLVVPWGNQNLRRNVRNLYNVTTQPWLVIVKNDEDGTVVSFDGKTDLFECGYFSLIEWKSMYKKVLQDIKEGKDKKKAKPPSPEEI